MKAARERFQVSPASSPIVPSAKEAGSGARYDPEDPPCNSVAATAIIARARISLAAKL